MTEAAGDGGAATMHMKYKIVFLGDPNVGKTSIILRFTQDTFDGNYQVSQHTCDEESPSLLIEIVLNFHPERVFSMLNFSLPLGDNRDRFLIQDNVRGR